MPTVRAGGNIPIRMDEIDLSVLLTGTTTSSSTLIRSVLPGGEVVEFTGTFVYGFAGALTGGTLTGIREFLNGVLVYEVTGISVPAVTFYGWVLGNQNLTALSTIFAGADDIIGSTSDDYLQGFGGNDIIDGGLGADTMDGGTGDDTYYIDNINDRVIDSSGFDTIVFSFNFVAQHDGTLERFILGTGVERGDGTSFNETIEGNALGNTIFGLAGDDILRGFSGNDILAGGAGNDIIDGGLGFDGASYADSTVAVTVSLSISTAQVTGFGTDTLISIEDLYGSNFDDRLTGASGAEYLFGRSGNDILMGMAGDDLLSGGDGDDVIDGGSGDDVISGGAGHNRIDGGAGWDMVEVSGSASAYRLLKDGDNFILKGPDGGDRLTNVEAIRFADGRILDLARMYGPDVDARAWGDGRIPEALLSGGAWSAERPLVLPGPAGDDVLIAKDRGGPEVLPGADEGGAWAWKDDDAPLVLPGAEDVFVVSAKAFDGPEVLPGVNDWTSAGVKGSDLFEVLPGLDERTLFTWDPTSLHDLGSGQMLTLDEQGLVVDHYSTGNRGSDGWSF